MEFLFAAIRLNFTNTSYTLFATYLLLSRFVYTVFRFWNNAVGQLSLCSIFSCWTGGEKLQNYSTVPVADMIPLTYIEETDSW